MAQCKLCDKTFDTQVACKKHMKFDHLLKNPFKCPFVTKVDSLKKSCTKQYGNYVDLVGHLQNRHGKKCYKCDFCDRIFLTKKYRDEHSKRIHERKYSEKYKSQCGSTFASAKGLQDHVKACKQGLGLKCDICGKCVISERNLKSHFTLAHPNIEDHVKVPETDENEFNPNEFIEKSQCYKCTKCNYISLTKSMVREHIFSLHSIDDESEDEIPT